MGWQVNASPCCVLVHAYVAVLDGNRILFHHVFRVSLTRSLSAKGGAHTRYVNA